ncbi:MAG: aminotransferase class I/II-fold pyridoxal phosphate-dependent enzyme [Planctomycetota bacterium]|nr:aminotransferase class I/II-fold pyridoxal phosphate-dependent enzyme [Planctomycetota bacterium]
MSYVAQRFRPFGHSIFAEMTALAQAHHAVNLSQGFPDFDGPDIAKLAAIDAIRDGHAQYARMAGLPALNAAIARAWQRDGRPAIDPEQHVTVTSGCSEGIVASMLGLLNPGDEVILFEPFFDFYVTGAAMAGATVRPVMLHPPRDPRAPGAAFWFDEADLAAAFSPRTRAIIVNTPHNPTGKVYTRDELACIASLAAKHNVIVITDEVYEHLTFDPALPHVSLATLPGMWDRTLTLSSLGKTFSLTGWKVGWAIGPEPLTRAIRAAHQFITFCAPTPLQHGAVAALDGAPEYAACVRELFTANRDTLAAALSRCGLTVFPSHGTYFVMADHTPLGFASDRAFCEHLTREVGVAAIPPSGFYLTPGAGRSLVRFAFCKRADTIAQAVRRLERLRPSTPG